MSFLTGYKTYVIAALILLCVFAEKILGFDIPGFEVGDDWLAFVLGALGLGTARAGAKSDVKNAL